MSAIPVEVVRPDKTTAEAVRDIFEGLSNLAMNAWIAMLLLPLFDQHWSYWKSVAAVALIDCLIPSNLRNWTRPVRKGRAK